MIFANVAVQLSPTPYELAYEFCDMDADQQAMFFNYISKIVNEWDEPFCSQVQAIVNSPKFEAQHILQMFGEYVK